MNKPAHGNIITKLIVSSERIYKIDITNLVIGDGISICVNASDYFQTGYIQGHTREGYYSEEDAPQLIWSYEDDSGDDKVLTEAEYNTLIWITLLILAGVVGTIIVVLVILPKMKERKIIKPEMEKSEIKTENVEKKETLITEKEITTEFCPYCGNKIPASDRFCSKCGKEVRFLN